MNIMILRRNQIVNIMMMKSLIVRLVRITFQNTDWQKSKVNQWMITLLITLCKDTQSNSYRFKTALVFLQTKVRTLAREIILFNPAKDNRNIQIADRNFINLLDNLRETNCLLLIRNILKIKNNIKSQKILFRNLICNLNCFSKKLRL